MACHTGARSCSFTSLDGAEAAPAPAVDLQASLLAAARDRRLTGRRLTDLVAAELKVPRRRVYQAYLALKEAKRLN